MTILVCMYCAECENNMHMIHRCFIRVRAHAVLCTSVTTDTDIGSSYYAALKASIGSASCAALKASIGSASCAALKASIGSASCAALKASIGSASCAALKALVGPINHANSSRIMNVTTFRNPARVTAFGPGSRGSIWYAISSVGPWWSRTLL